ncbi:MAG: hypothetical protein R2828_06550 [Saprospiraceae bacterium]
MARFNPDEKHLNVVLIGNFNPRIFHPQWFANHNIISEADFNYIVEGSDVLIHKQVAQFKSSWFHLEVTETRLQIICTQEAYFEMILDFLASTFSVLHHTPIQQMGINLTVRQRLDRSEDVERFDTKFFTAKGYKDIDVEAQPFTMKLRFNSQENRVGTQCNFEITKTSKDAYFMNINQHFEIGKDTNGKDLVRTIGQYGRESLNTNDQILEKIIKSKN